MGYQIKCVDKNYEDNLKSWARQGPILSNFPARMQLLCMHEVREQTFPNLEETSLAASYHCSTCSIGMAVPALG